jgi:HAD superfamily hydrolase (TIGR01490 family)
MKLTLFDLDHTLLNGDSDVLWCEFLVRHGILERESFSARNADMEARYKNGTVGPEEFANFYVGTLAGRSPREWEPFREMFYQEMILPRIGSEALGLVRRHLDAGDLVVMTTATNRFIAELTSAHFGIDNLIATEPELHSGCFTGRTIGTLNMREGKVVRLSEWLGKSRRRLEDFDSTAYSDSINDFPLLQSVQRPVAVNPDIRLLKEAQSRAWEVLQLLH